MQEYIDGNQLINRVRLLEMHPCPNSFTLISTKNKQKEARSDKKK